MEIKIFVPLVSDKTKATKRFIKAILKEFGGYTVIKAKGYWLNPETNKTEIDKIEVFEILLVNHREDTQAIIENELKKLKIALAQKSILYSINGEPFFIE